MTTRTGYLALLFLGLFLLVGCAPEETQTYNVSLIADGRERRWQVDEPITVQEFLNEIEFELGSLDRMVPEPWTQIHDGILITVRRVQEEDYCEEAEIPYERRTELFEGLAQGESRTGQTGQNGIEEICYRVRIEDGERQEPVVTGRTVIVEAQDEVVLVGPSEELEPVAIVGTLTYLNNGNAWTMSGSSRTKRPLTVEGDLDGRVFSISDDGRKLLYTRRDLSDTLQGNMLWMIPDLTIESIRTTQLVPQDILYAEWIPGANNTVAYSTFEPQDVSPGLKALNDLWRMRIDPQTGEQIDIEEVLPSSSGGRYGWWGTGYYWAPDGNRLAWVRADGIGLVDLESGELGEYLLNYTELTPSIGDWSWRASVSWSPNGSLIATTVHGLPVGNEPPASSPVFNVAVTAADGSFNTTIIERSGIWAEPTFSPEINTPGAQFPQGYLAYFQAREWENSISGEYNLVVADRDGSNAQVIFPKTAGQSGLEDEDLQLSWSPDGRQVAFIYLGNLWIIDVETGVAHQLTQGGGTSNPVWTQ